MSPMPTLDRRAFVRGAGLLCAGMWAAPALAITEAELFPVATTRYGKIKGIAWSGVHAFKWGPDQRIAMIFDINTRAVARPHSRLQEMWREVESAQVSRE